MPFVADFGPFHGWKALLDFDMADRQEEPAMLLRAGQRQTKGYLRGGSRELESA
jgi:hypothetical protein